MEFIIGTFILCLLIVGAAIIWNNVWLPYKRKQAELLKYRVEPISISTPSKTIRESMEDIERSRGIHIQPAFTEDMLPSKKKYQVKVPTFNKRQTISEMMEEQTEQERQRAAYQRRLLQEELAQSQALNQRLRQEAALRKAQESKVRVNPNTGLWEHVDQHLKNGENLEAALDILKHFKDK